MPPKNFGVSGNAGHASSEQYLNVIHSEKSLKKDDLVAKSPLKTQIKRSDPAKFDFIKPGGNLNLAGGIRQRQKAARRQQISATTFNRDASDGLAYGGNGNDGVSAQASSPDFRQRIRRRRRASLLQARWTTISRKT